MPNDQGLAPSAQYGPFTDTLTSPFVPHQQQPLQQAPYATSAPGALAAFANSFLQGAQRGERHQYEQSEQMKMEHERNFDSVYEHIQGSPYISAQGKAQAEQTYLLQKFGRVGDHLGKGGKNDHPLMNFARAITGAAIGPNENKAHQDIDVNTLLSYVNDPQYRISPSQMGETAASQLLDVLSRKEKGTPGSPAVPGVTPSGPSFAQMITPQGGPDFQAQSPQSQPAQGPQSVMRLPGQTIAQSAAPSIAQIAAGSIPQTDIRTPVTGTPAVDAVPGQILNQRNVMLDPDVQRALDPLRKEGRDPFKDPYTGHILSSLPPAGPGKLVNTKLEYDPETKDYHYVDEFQQPDGTLSRHVRGVAPTPASVNPNMQQVWVKTSPEANATRAWVNPKNPHGFFDENNQALPAGTVSVGAPSEGMGMARVFADMARAEFAKEGNSNPTSQDIRIRSGLVAERYMGTPIARQQQEMDMRYLESGVNPGPGFGGLSAAPAPAAPAINTAPPPGQPLFMNPNAYVPGINGGPRSIPGLLQPGNIDLTRLPILHNGPGIQGVPEGSYSTVHSMGIGETDSRGNPVEVLIPLIANGKTLPENDAGKAAAIQEYKKSGLFLGKFNDIGSAVTYARNLHSDWDAGKIPGVRLVNGTVAGQPAAQTPAAPLNRPTAQLPVEGGLGGFPSSEALKNARIYYNQQMGTGTAPGAFAIRSQGGQEALAAATHLDPASLSAEITANKGNTDALKTSYEVAGAYQRLQETIKKHSDVLLSAAKAYGPGNVPLVNFPVQWLEKNIQAHPELQKYLIALQAVRVEYGKLIAGGAQSRAMTPAGALQEGDKLLSANSTMKDVVAAVQQLKLESSKDQEAFKTQQADLKDKLADSKIGQAFNPTVKVTYTDKFGTHTTRVRTGMADAFRKGIEANKGKVL